MIFQPNSSALPVEWLFLGVALRVHPPQGPKVLQSAPQGHRTQDVDVLGAPLGGWCLKGCTNLGRENDLKLVVVEN